MLIRLFHVSSYLIRVGKSSLQFFIILELPTEEYPELLIGGGGVLGALIRLPGLYIIGEAALLLDTEEPEL